MARGSGVRAPGGAPKAKGLVLQSKQNKIKTPRGGIRARFKAGQAKKANAGKSGGGGGKGGG